MSVCTITFLSSPDTFGGKTHTPAGTNDYVLPEGPFAVVRANVNTLGELAHLLPNVPFNAFAVRGVPIDPHATHIPYRRTKARGLEPPSLRAEPTRWVAVDWDGKDTQVMTDLRSAAEQVRAQLPPPYYALPCLAQATSSAGVKPGTRVRLHFLLDEPRASSDCKADFAHLPEVDPSAFVDAQPIYVTAPRFIGLPDPFPERFAFLVAPELPVPPPPAPARPATATHAPAARTGTRPVTEADRSYVRAALDELQMEWWQRGTRPGTRRRDLYNDRVFAIGTRAWWLGDVEAVRAQVHAIFTAWHAQAGDGHITLAELLARVNQAFNEGAAQPAEPREPEGVAPQPPGTSTAPNRKATKLLRDQCDRLRDDPALLPDVAARVKPEILSKALTEQQVASRFMRALQDGADDRSETQSITREVVLQVLAAAQVTPEKDREAWQLALTPGADGGFKYGPENLALLLEHHPSIALWYDTRAEQAQWERCPWGGPARPVNEDFDSLPFRRWIERTLGWPKLPVNPHEVLTGVSVQRPWDPWRGWLDALRWDGVSRLTHAAPELLGANADAERITFAWWLISAVARTYQPGCQVDHLIVLEGDQGLGKSSFLITLATHPRYYSRIQGTSGDLVNPRVIGKLQGPVIVELAELSALSKRDVGAVKDFIDNREDKWQPLYAAATRPSPRKIVFAGTTNDSNYLQDVTGGRRYWPIRVTRTIDLARTREWTEQLWAEAVHLYRAGVRWYPSPEEATRLGLLERADERREHGSLEAPLGELLARVFVPDSRDGLGLKPPAERWMLDAQGRVVAARLKWLHEHLEISHRESRELSRALHAHGFERTQVRRGTAREWIYEVKNRAQRGCLA